MSDGVFPRWLKAVDTLKAIEKALRCYARGTNEIKEVRDNPVGRVDWYSYAVRNAPYGKCNLFDCTGIEYSLDIGIHRIFKGVVEQIEKDLGVHSVPVNVKRRALPILQLVKKS